jgi:uracil-DNA glycosylase
MYLDNWMRQNDIHSEWVPLLNEAMLALSPQYITYLFSMKNPIPAPSFMFSAFKLPLSHVKTILMGESPYPRHASANGFAFWDNQVQSLWSSNGLSKEINKATSLRNFIKMCLHAKGVLPSPFTQAMIAAIDKSTYHQTGEALFLGMMEKGILLLNASLIYEPLKVNFHAKSWAPFIDSLLNQVFEISPSVTLILFGKMAKAFGHYSGHIALSCMHPYNLGFISDSDVLAFFKPLNLLEK